MKRIVFLLLIIFPIELNAQQDMIWINTSISFVPPNAKYQFRVEDRVYSNFEQKTILTEGNVSFGKVIKPIVGGGHWQHKSMSEPRLYQGIEYKALRVLMEERFFQDDFKLRIRTRVKFKKEIFDKTKFTVSDEVFFQRGYDHNRLKITVQRDIMKRFALEGGYMFYHCGNYCFDVLLIFTSWNF